MQLNIKIFAKRSQFNFLIGYEPNGLTAGLCTLLLVLIFAPCSGDAMDEKMYRFDPAKRIPLLNESNWSEWSWRIAAAFAAMGIATNVLWTAQDAADDAIRSGIIASEPTTNEYKGHKKNYHEAALQRQLATSGTEEYKKADEAVNKARKAMEEEKKKMQASSALHAKDPFHSASDSQKSSCFQLLVRTISAELDFLVMNFTAAQLTECWFGIREYFSVNTRGVRNQLKVKFFSMIMEPGQRLAEFKNRIEFSARQLNSMSPSDLISDDDKTTVLMSGVRKHHDAHFKTTLEVLEQSTNEFSFEEVYRRLIPAARRSEQADVSNQNEQQGLLSQHQHSRQPPASHNKNKNEVCRQFQQGRCRRSRCRFSHNSSPTIASRKVNRGPCGYCKGSNHDEKNCFKKMNANNNKTKDTRHNKQEDDAALILRVRNLEKALKKTQLVANNNKRKGKQNKDKTYLAAADSNSESSEIDFAFFSATVPSTQPSTQRHVPWYSTFLMLLVFFFTFGLCRCEPSSLLLNHFSRKPGISKIGPIEIFKRKLQSNLSILTSWILSVCFSFMTIVHTGSNPVDIINSSSLTNKLKIIFSSCCRKREREKTNTSFTRSVHVNSLLNCTFSPNTQDANKNTSFIALKYFFNRIYRHNYAGKRNFWHHENWALFSCNFKSDGASSYHVALRYITIYIFILLLPTLFPIISTCYCIVRYVTERSNVYIGEVSMFMLSFFAIHHVMTYLLSFRHFCGVILDDATTGTTLPPLDDLVGDTGATSHLFGSLDNFIPSSIRRTSTAIRVAGGDCIYATHIGDRKLTVVLPNGQKVVRILKDCLYVPNVPHNLISIRKFDEAGFKTVISNGTMTVIDNNNTIFMQGKLQNGLYKLNVPQQVDVAVLAGAYIDPLPAIDLWHRRLGHAAGVYLKGVLSTRQAKEKLSYCDACIQAKAHRRPFKRSKAAPNTTSTTEVLDMIVSDVCGPFRVLSLAGCRYFVSFIDVASRFIFIFFMKMKSDVADVLRKWLLFLKQQFSKVPKRFHSDGGGEYVNHQVRSILDEHGIQMTTSAPHSPSQNPIAERFNRTIMESARAMMYLSAAPQYLWAEAVAFAAYLRNRLPSKSLSMAIPIIKFYGTDKAPAPAKLYRHVHVWGCKAWALTRDSAGKLLPRAVECTFLGVDQLKAGYRLLRLSGYGRSVIISRDVFFDESSMPMRDVRETTPHQLSSPSSTPFHPPATTTGVTSEILPVSPALQVRSTAPVTGNDSSSRSLRAHPPPSAQALRNIAGDAADLCDAEIEHDMPAFMSDSDTDSDSDVFDASVPPAAYLSRASRAKRFKRKKKSADPDEPSSRKQMLKLHPDTINKWQAAEQEELAAMKNHGTWVEVPISQVEQEGRVPVGCRWVYKIKRNADHTIERYRARLTAQGYSQIFGLDYVDVFAAVAHLKSFRLVLALSMVYNWTITHVDISNAFLNGDLKETIYMKHPEGYEGTPGTYLRLLKSIYGLKQSGRVWNEKLLSVLHSIGFLCNPADKCILWHKIWQCLLCITVDDLLIATATEEARTAVMTALHANFKIRDLGAITRYVGIQVQRYASRLFIHQTSYIEQMISRYGMQDCKPAPTPSASPTKLTKKQCPTSAADKADVASFPYKSMVGSLWYAANGCRVDITYATNLTAQFASDFGEAHCLAVKRILRYLRGAASRGITYSVSSVVQIIAYSDSDWANDEDSRRSRTGYIVTVSGGAVSWQTKMQKTVALSSCEAELYALCECVKELLWLIEFLSSMNIKFEKPKLFVDNEGAIALAENPVHHQRTKHIAVRWFFIRDVVESKTIEIAHVKSNKNWADINTKGTTAHVFKPLIDEIMPKMQDEVAMLARTKQHVIYFTNSRGYRFTAISRQRSLSENSLLCRCSVLRCHMFKKWQTSIQDWNQTCAYCSNTTANYPYCSLCFTSARLRTTNSKWYCPKCKIT